MGIRKGENPFGFVYQQGDIQNIKKIENLEIFAKYPLKYFSIFFLILFCFSLFSKHVFHFFSVFLHFFNQFQGFQRLLSAYF